jgi:integrase
MFFTAFNTVMNSHVSTQQAAEALGITSKGVLKAIYTGRLEAFQHRTGARMAWRIPQSALPTDDWGCLMNEWEVALSKGRGYPRPFSSDTVAIYLYGVQKLWSWAGGKPSLGKWGPALLEKALAGKPAGITCQFSQREKVYKSYRALSKWLISRNQGTPALLEGLERLKPKRFDPARRLKIPKEAVNNVVGLAGTFCQTAWYKSRFELMVKLIYMTGLRANEAARLPWEALNLHKGTATVVGKGRKVRLVPLPQPLIHALIEWRPQTNGHPLVLAGWTADAMQICLGRFSETTGVKVTLHGLRRTAATAMVECGVPVTQVQKVLGHAQLSTTQLYVEADEVAACQSVNAAFAHFKF